MSSFTKKLFSAFVEINDDDNLEKEKPAPVVNNQPVLEGKESNHQASPADTEKFSQYFEKLFADANLPGPDYYEFSKMTEAMQALPDVKTRFATAFAGLSVQGLSREKLLDSATQYLKILDADAEQFNGTINEAVHQKVENKKKELDEKMKRIQELNHEISDLNNSVALINGQIKENEEKIRESGNGYKAALGNMKAKIMQDMERIQQFIG